MTFNRLAVAAVAAFAIMAVPALAETVGEPYTLNTCAVSGKELGSMGDPIVISHEGREIKFCCGGCEAPFEKDAAKYLEAVDAKMIEAQDDHYPLDTCLVSGKALDSKGEPVAMIVANREVKLCCGGCKKPAAANPEDTIAKLDEAVVAKQADSYKATKCPVSGKDLGSMGDPINYMHEGRLVRFCCAGCTGMFEKYPEDYLAKLDQAIAEQQQGTQ